MPYLYVLDHLLVVAVEEVLEGLGGQEGRHVVITPLLLAPRHSNTADRGKGEGQRDEAGVEG